MSKSPADDGWTKEQWEQKLKDPQQFEDLEEVRVNAMHRAKACAKKAFAKGRAAAKEWAAMAMTQGAKLADRWTATKPQLAEEVISGTEHLCTPVDMMSSCFKTFSSQVAESIRLYSRHCYGNPGRKGVREGESGSAQN